jgi:hypothetical protein
MAFVSMLNRHRKPWMERYEPALYADPRFVLLRSVPLSHLRSLSKMRLLLPWHATPWCPVLSSCRFTRSPRPWRTETPGAWGGVRDVERRQCPPSVASASKDTARYSWLFDSWEGLPEPTQEDVLFDGKAGQTGWAADHQKKIRKLLLQKAAVAPVKGSSVRGWVDDVIPARKCTIGPILYRLLDCDWHHSTQVDHRIV